MKIALCGSAPSSAQLTPFRDASYEEWAGKTQQFPRPEYADETWEVWGCSPGLWAVAERATRWFELHRWEPGKPWFSPEYVSFLQRFRGQVYTGGPVPEIENHIVYPLDAMESIFSAYFLHSSLSLMSAIAITDIEARRNLRKTARRAHDNPAHGVTMDPALMQELLAEEDDDDLIGYFGVDMAANDEYGDQRSGCHFFILEAMRRGIQIYTPQESCLLRPKPVYGISEWDHNYIKATVRMRELNARRAQAEQTIRDTAKSADFLSGAIDNHNYWINTWTSPYGIPAGLRIKHEPGTGLGGGITLHRPFSPPPDNVIEAGLAEPLAQTIVANSNAGQAEAPPPPPPVEQQAPKPKKPAKKAKAKRIK